MFITIYVLLCRYVKLEVYVVIYSMYVITLLIYTALCNCVVWSAISRTAWLH